MKFVQSQLPIFAFGACLVLAILAGVLTPGGWIAALAIAIAGLALALALRADGYHQAPSQHEKTAETHADLHDELTALREELKTHRAIIDELAELMEMMTVENEGSTSAHLDTGPELTALRQEIDTLAGKAVTIGDLNAFSARLDHLEQEFSARKTVPMPSESRGRSALSGLANKLRGRDSATAASAAGLATVGASSALLLSGGRTNAEPNAPFALYAEDADQPSGYLIDARADDLNACRAALEAAKSYAQQGLRTIIAFPDVAFDNPEELAQLMGMLQPGIIPMFPQSALPSVPSELRAQAKQHSGFAVDQISDWSLNFAALAKDGLRYLAVNGPRMVDMAREQGGDPTRLKAVLSHHGIDLIATDAADTAQRDATKTLLPDLILGQRI